MKTFLLVFLVGLVGINNSFSQVTLEGFVRNSENKSFVSYVNIGLVNKSKGTVSGNDGSFRLVLEKNDINNTDTIRISGLGYITKSFTSKEFLDSLKYSKEVFMFPSKKSAKNTSIEYASSETERIGYIGTSSKVFAFWNDTQALGGEHATKIEVNQRRLKIEDLSFNLITNVADSVLVRVNIYDIEKGLPGRNILRKNVLHTIKRKRGRVIIDLSDFDIIVNKDFIVSLELLKSYGNEIGMVISTFENGLQSFTRYSSQDVWRRMDKGVTVAFNLNTMEVKGAQRNQMSFLDESRPKPSQVNILWDNSLSMSDRNVSSEFLFLDEFFKYVGNVTVELQTFGYANTPTKTFQVKNANWEDLKNELKRIRYDGVNVSQAYDKLDIGDYALLFTDGVGFPNDINRLWSGTVFTVNSKRKANHNLLKKIAEDSDANYLNLNQKNDINLVLTFVKFNKRDDSDYSNTSLVINQDRSIQGTVTDFDLPLYNVKVQNKESGETTTTSPDGSFSILAKNNDVLVFSYPGREDITQVIDRNTSKLNIAMPIGITILDEVVVEDSRIDSDESVGMPNKESISTNFGALDPEKTGFAVKQIHDEQIGSIYRNLSDILIGKFPGVKVIGTAGEARVALRSNEILDIYAAWDVDGILYPPDQPPLHIDVDNVKSITVMPGGWAAARYGALAGGGVIIVKTISQSFEGGRRTGEKPYDQALLRDNLYENDALDIISVKRVEPRYVQLIREESDFQKAYDKYLEQRILFGNMPRFFSDVHDVFVKDFNEKNTAIKVLSNIQELFKTDMASLKFLAYKLEEEGELELAKTVYEEILSIDENKPQSRRDLANINVRLGNIREAWTIYRDYLLTRDEVLTDSGLDKIIKSEMIELVKHNTDSISSFKTNIPEKLSSNEISILFEWNDPSAEFELQFVNPQNRYFVWKHTQEANQNLINDEVLKGYSSNMFEIETRGNGRWLVNAKYMGNQGDNSSYLKMTIRNNKSKTEKVKLIELKNKNVNYNILSF